jgi:hypothetical protein
MLIACRLAIAADEQPVRAPHIEPGDCWTYRAEGLTNREEIRSYEECVTFVDRTKDVILATARINDGEREIETSYTSDWGGIVSIDGLIVPGALRFFKFPMRPGDSYSVDFEFRLAVLGEFAGRAKYEIKVVGWEDVTVPAGTFRALRLEARGTIRRYDLGSFGNLRNDFWYSPQVHRWVKSEFSSAARANRRELVKYRLNQ